MRSLRKVHRNLQTLELEIRICNEYELVSLNNRYTNLFVIEIIFSIFWKSTSNRKCFMIVIVEKIPVKKRWYKKNEVLKVQFNLYILIC